MAIIQANFMSKSLMRTVTVNVVLPVDKLTKPGDPVREKKPFKTLYLLHGIFGDYTDWITGTRVARWAQENNLAVVMPSGENHFYVDDERAGHYYGRFIGEELVQMTRDMFPLSDKREDTFIGGLSMGGYGALKLALRAPETFSCAASLSGGVDIVHICEQTSLADDHYWEDIFGPADKVRGSFNDLFAAAEELKASGKPLPKLYMWCGTEDFLYGENVRMRDHLNALGYDLTYEESPGDHQWKYWDQKIQTVLDWLPLGGEED